MEKSYNQRWKESGTTLTYKEWRRREDEKMASFDGIPSPSELIKKDPSYQNTQNTIIKQSGYKTEISGNTIFGINKYVVYLGGLLIVGAIAYKIYTKKK